MRRLITLPAALLALTASLAAHGQDDDLTGPSARVFLDCAKKCERSFYFSEQSDATFAELRGACIEGCAFVDDSNMAAYQTCSVGCQDIFPYRHGIRSEFADFQKACVVGCRRVR